MNNTQPRTSLHEYIKTKYNVETTQLAQIYEKTLHKIAWQANYLIFNIRSSKAGLIPRSIWIKPPINTRRGYITEKTARQFQREWIT